MLGYDELVSAMAEADVVIAQGGPATIMDARSVGHRPIVVPRRGHLDEVVVAMFVSGGDNPTLTRNMFNALRDQIDPTIASISTIMIVVTSLLMVLAQLFGRGK